MRSFIWRPRWILSHLLVLVLVVTMIGLGFWQLRRLDERRDANQVLEDRALGEPVPLSDLEPVDDPGSVEYTRVVVTGRFDDAGAAFVANRNLDGRPGSWLLTPLVTDSGDAVAVNRGFVPRSVVLDPDLADYSAPDGEVSVEGVIRESANGGTLGDVAAGELPELSVADVDVLGSIAGLPLGDMYVQALEVTPGTVLPEPLPLPDLGEGPHLAYAFQWFTFSAIGIVGYYLVLRRVARGDESRGDVAPDWDL